MEAYIDFSEEQDIEESIFCGVQKDIEYLRISIEVNQ